MPDVYLFLESNSVGKGGDDRFVFSHDCWRIESGGSRDFIASMVPNWRPWSGKETAHVSVQFAGSWKQEDYLLESADIDVDYRLLEPKSYQQALATCPCRSMPAPFSATFNIRDFDTNNLSST